MRKFNINVNGKTYSVEVEETTDGAISAVSAPVQVATPVAKPAPVRSEERRVGKECRV